MKEKKKFDLYRTLIAIGIALFTGYVIVFISNMPSGDIDFATKISQAFDKSNEAFKYFLLGPIIKWRKDIPGFNESGFIQWINESVPIMITGLAICIVFSAKIFNIGAEGQLFIGAAGATFVAVNFPAIPFLHPLVVMGSAMLFGAGWAVIPAIMKSKLKASELVTSLMMNYVAFFLSLFLIKTFIRDTNAGSLVSLPFKETALLPLINERYKWHIGIFIAIGLAVFIWFLLKKTTWGYRVRILGDNINFAHYSGINTSKMLFQTQVVSGAVAGLAGITELMGYHYRFLWLFSPGYGWDGIIIATLARNNPIFVPVAALFLSYIRVGAKIMGRYTDIPPEIVSILQAVIILLVTAEAFLSKWKQRAIEKEATKFELINGAGEVK